MSQPFYCYFLNSTTSIHYILFSIHHHALFSHDHVHCCGSGSPSLFGTRSVSKPKLPVCQKLTCSANAALRPRLSLAMVVSPSLCKRPFRSLPSKNMLIPVKFSTFGLPLLPAPFSAQPLPAITQPIVSNAAPEPSFTGLPLEEKERRYDSESSMFVKS